MSDHIVIGDIRPRIQYTADGTQTVFTYPFPIFADADLKVYLGDALQSGGYTVGGAGQSAGGNVTFAAAPAAGTKVTLLRALAIARTSDFQEGGAFRAKTINDELDRQTAFVQEVGERIERALVAGPTESAAPLVLPPPTARANALLGFDAAGAPIAAAGTAGTVPVAPAMAPLVQAADMAAARTVLGLGTAAVKNHGDGDADLPLGSRTRLARLPESVKTADYALAAADAGAMLIADKATPIAFTLPAAAALGPGFAFMARNAGAGDLAIDPDGAATINGAATLVLKQHEAALLWTDGANWRANVWAQGGGISAAILQDHKPDGTNAQTPIADAWAKRDLNTVAADPDGMVSLAGNDFTLGAGKYFVRWTAPATGPTPPKVRHRLWNATDLTQVALGSSQSFAGGVSGNTGNIMDHGTAYLVLAVTKSFCIQYYCSSSLSGDLGVHDGMTLGVEIFTCVEILKIG